MSAIRIGEGFAGEGAHAAHVNTVLGPLDGPVGSAWTVALATPTAGHAPFLVAVRPGLPVRPFTLLVAKARIADDRHARLTWGAAHAGVAAAVGRAIGDGVISPAAALADVLIATVWVDPAATDEDAVHEANRAATYAALQAGAAGRPTLDEVVAEAAHPWNRYFARRAGGEASGEAGDTVRR